MPPPSVPAFAFVCLHTRAFSCAQWLLLTVVHRPLAREGQPMRWQALFDDLEAQLAEGEAAELQAEVADRTRREVGLVRVVDRLAAASGHEVAVALGAAGVLRGRILDAGV